MSSVNEKLIAMGYESCKCDPYNTGAECGSVVVPPSDFIDIVASMFHQYLRKGNLDVEVQVMSNVVEAWRDRWVSHNEGDITLLVALAEVYNNP